jgi:hypothetical protein
MLQCACAAKSKSPNTSVGTQESKHERVAGYGCVCGQPILAADSVHIMYNWLLHLAGPRDPCMPSPASILSWWLYVALDTNLVRSMVHSTTMRPWPLATARRTPSRRKRDAHRSTRPLRALAMNQLHDPLRCVSYERVGLMNTTLPLSPLQCPREKRGEETSDRADETTVAVVTFTVA